MIESNYSKHLINTCGVVDENDTCSNQWDFLYMCRPAHIIFINEINIPFEIMNCFEPTRQYPVSTISFFLELICEEWTWKDNFLLKDWENFHTRTMSGDYKYFTMYPMHKGFGLHGPVPPTIVPSSVLFASGDANLGRQMKKILSSQQFTTHRTHGLCHSNKAPCAQIILVMSPCWYIYENVSHSLALRLMFTPK